MMRNREIAQPYKVLHSLPFQHFTIEVLDAISKGHLKGHFKAN